MRPVTLCSATPQASQRCLQDDNLQTPADGFLSLQAIPAATSIVSRLQEMGLPLAVAKRVDGAYLRTSDELRDVCETSLRAALRDASSQSPLTADQVKTMNQVWIASHAQQTRQWAEDALSRARAFLATVVPEVDASNITKEKKPVFNHEYTPLLEKYFEYNAYPSARDRAVLARKSMMTQRQIEVWFQNHRNRARKDGKRLRKLSTDPLPIQLSLESLEKEMSFFTLPESERPVDKPASSEDDSSDEEYTPLVPPSASSSDSADILSIPAPPHAFPTCYPPRCDYKPFPTKAEGFSFPASVWRRMPATSRPLTAPIDFEDFTLDFSLKLILREPPSRKERRKATDGSSPAPWFAWRHTIPPSAPHPSLVRVSSAATLRCMLPVLPSIVAPSSRLHPFRSPSPCAQPATLVPPQQQTSSPTRRKVAHLPNRTPKNPSTSHRRGSPAISEASPSPSSRSLSSNSRSSSFGSDTPSKRRPSSSSSSSSSSPPSALTTPTLPHATLPDDTRSPTISVAGLDFQNMDDLFGDSNSALSPIEGLPLDFHTVAPRKQGLDFSISLPTAGLLQQRS
uniref:Mating-type protein HD2.2 n=1 Tax=Hypsizygus marmoreus TaxID=39966 RepID=A0A7T7DKN9_HYPMA|nr:mating-type protein HD2.2 [Hypsizygus marmoreus]